MSHLLALIIVCFVEDIAHNEVLSSNTVHHGLIHTAEHAGNTAEDGGLQGDPVFGQLADVVAEEACDRRRGRSRRNRSSTVSNSRCNK